MEASQAEKNTFGADVKLHPITKMPLEQGRGALPHDQQAMMHCDVIEHQHGKHHADAMRRELAASRTIDEAKAEIEQDEVELHHHRGEHDV